MITISLDEQGNFEKEEHKPLFVAGIIFDDQNHPGEVQIERQRIEAYYRRVIADADHEGNEDFVYPDALHSNGDSSRDHHVVRPVKERVTATLAEFLQHGTYKEQALCNDAAEELPVRSGTYHLFVMLKSDDGKQSLLGEDKNIFARDDFAANRYFHMAGSVVNRIIFHNPLFEKTEIPSIIVDVATRSTGNADSMDEETKEEFQKQSYSLTGPVNFKHYSIMNADIYRSLISQEMLSSDHAGIDLQKISVRSIQYRPDKHDMEFLYMSDSLCSILGFRLEGNSADDWLKQIADRVKNLNPHQNNLIFGYDEIDNAFAKAWGFYEENRYFEVLNTIYDASKKEGKFAEYYQKNWFPFIEERMMQTIDPDYFENSVHQMTRMVKTNNLDQEKLLYLFQHFEAMLPIARDKYHSLEMQARLCYGFYDAGISAYCHIGDAKTALRYYEKCKEYAYYAGVETFLRTSTKLLVCLEDCFEWKAALEIAKKVTELQGRLSTIKAQVLGDSVVEASEEEAISISQMARIMALTHEPETEQTFRRALSQMKHGSANYKITQSYFLHYLADTGQEEAFEREAADYFDGVDTYENRLKYILDMKEETHAVFSKEYALYVLFRGFYRFHPHSLDDGSWHRICEMMRSFTGEDGKEPGGHPWELTYKYMELLAILKGDENNRREYAQLKRTCLEKRGPMIIALEMFGDAEAADCSGNMQERDRITKDLAGYLTREFDALKTEKFSGDGNSRYRELEKYFTFMYR